jgi:hypothetical protein
MTKKNPRIQRIIVNARVHRNKDRKRLGFALPIPAVEALGIKSNEKLTVLIRTDEGRPIYLGQRNMTSKYGIYETDMNVQWGQSIFVEISVPTN